jgi:hypothetical protein
MAVSVNRNFDKKAMKMFGVREIPVRNIRGITNNNNSNDNKIIITIIIEDECLLCLEGSRTVNNWKSDANSVVWAWFVSAR